MTLSNDNLPPGWRWESLTDVAEDGVPILYGILQPGPDTPGGIPYVRPTEIVEDVIDLSSIRRTTPTIAGKYKRSVLKPDDVILSIVGTIGKVAVVPPELDGGNITQSSVRVRPHSEIVSPRYVAWVLRSPVLRKQYDIHRLGTAVPRLNVAHVRGLRVPVPPLPEQRRIVAEIEKQFTRLEAGVAALRRVQANLKRYRAAVLKAACEGKLVPTEAEFVGRVPPRGGGRTQAKGNAASGDAAYNDATFESGEQLLKRILAERRQHWTGRGQYKEPAAPDTAKLGPLPNGWAWANATSVCEQLIDCHNKTAPYTTNGIALVRTTNIRNGKINLDETRFVSQPTYEFWSRRCTPKPGDVLFTREAPMGEAGIIPDGVTLCMGQRMMLLRASTGILNRYLLMALLAPGLIAHITRTAVGSGVKHLRVRDVELLPVPLPPLVEQKRIVAEVERRLSVVEELESVVLANLQRATRLRQSILQRAFSGQL